jgi:hypothetical protein
MMVLRDPDDMGVGWAARNSLARRHCEARDSAPKQSRSAESMSLWDEIASLRSR